ncbi:MAG: hypothetical protein AAGC55_25490, partial [Myxococcota bacterium]
MRTSAGVASQRERPALARSLHPHRDWLNRGAAGAGLCLDRGLMAQRRTSTSSRPGPRSGRGDRTGPGLAAQPPRIGQVGFWLATVALWSAVGLMSGLQLYLARDGTMSLGSAVLHQLPCWYVWVPLTPVVLTLGERLLQSRPPAVSAVVHVVLAALITVAHPPRSVVGSRRMQPPPH